MQRYHDWRTAQLDMKELREIVYSRCGGYCEKCGGGLPEGWALHHRKLRSRGGKDTPDNCVALHHNCHNLASYSVHNNPAEAERTGFMVSAWQDSFECPLTLPDGNSVILTPEGTYHYLGGKRYGW